MTMQPAVDPIEALALAEDDQIVRVEVGAIGAITKSEVEAQIDAAHKYPRSITRFLNEAVTLATVTQEVAESCIYSLPRDGKLIAGPSVRLAEICASAYGNMHMGARVVDVEETNVVAQGIAWDIQKNLRATLEVKRRITNKSGRRYNEDMITLTGNAAASIALRNAIFRVIPRSYVMGIYERARVVAVGNAQTLDAKRTALLDRLQKIGVSQERVLQRLGKAGVPDIGLEDMEVLIGLGTAIKNNDQSIDEAFPASAPAPVAPEQDGRRISIKGSKSGATTADDPKAQGEPGERG